MPGRKYDAGRENSFIVLYGSVQVEYNRPVSLASFCHNPTTAGPCDI
jgi:hypothetical protein